jgi:hypothetical protein
MKGFLRQWIYVNRIFLEGAFRRAAQLFPGPPSYALLFIDNEGETHMSSTTVSDTSGPLNAHVTFLDAHGHETTADDVPQWTSDNEGVASVAASSDGMSAEVTVSGTPGAAVISVDSTNTDGSTVHSQGTITVLPGDAVSGDVTFEGGEPPPDTTEPPAEGEPVA